MDYSFIRVDLPEKEKVRTRKIKGESIEIYEVLINNLENII